MITKTSSNLKHDRRTSLTPDAEDGPIQKKLKRQLLGPSVSFADVLGRMEEAGDPAVSEGGADRWNRPLPLPLDEKTDCIVFQHIDIQESTNHSTLLMFGITEAGHTILAHILDFFPYLYVPSPPGFTADDARSLAAYINDHMVAASGDPVKEIQITKHRDQETLLLRITVANPSIFAKVQGMFDNGECSFGDLFSEPVHTYESDVDYTLRFMIDKNIVGMSWIEVPAGKYRLFPNNDKQSNCQIEFSVKWDDLIPHRPEGSWSRHAPLRILSFDIECTIRERQFPDPHLDPVIQIANMVTLQGEEHPFIRNIFTLGTCSPITGSQVLSYDNEPRMLQAWSDFIEQVDPDVVIGYNIRRFDLPYLFIRAKTLEVGRFPFLGRLKDVQVRTMDIPRQQRDWKNAPVLHGRLQIDLLHLIQYERKTVHTLGVISEQVLGDKKEDVHFSRITELQNGTADTRRQLAVYCLKDAYLPQKLLDKLGYLHTYIERSRDLGVPFKYLLMNDRMIKYSRLIRTAKEKMVG